MKEPMRLATALTVLLLTACRPSAEPVRIGLAGPFSDPVGGPMKPSIFTTKMLGFMDAG